MPDFDFGAGSLPDAQLLSALPLFEAAARHGNLTAAARELGLTQSALSRRIQHLEQGLGTVLFSRQGRRLVITAAGERLAATARATLSLVEGARHALGGRAQGVVRVGALPSVGAFWLAPRLGGFLAAHPEVVVELVTIDADFTAAHKDPVRWDPAALDLVITWGHGGWRGLTATTLAMEELVAVAAPALMAGGSPADAEALLALPRIEHTTRAGAWAGWAEGQGVVPAGRRAAAARPAQLRLEHFFMVMEAAKAGLGVGLLPRLIVAAELAAGSLVELLPGTGWKTGASYALVASEAALARPAVGALSRYLVASATA